MSVPSWRDKLTDEQIIAASHFGSHARLLAGPGTGKTYTLARRIVFLVTEQGVDASEILVLTFTRMATRQLRSTIKQELSPYTKNMPHISTLHGFSLRQLRRNSRLIDNLPQPLRIADDWEESDIIYPDMMWILARFRKEIRAGFTELSADWQTLEADKDGWKDGLPDAKFVSAWEQHRQVFGYTLRAELVYQLKKAMEQVPGFVLEPRFKHVLIDEYQGLNPCDLAIARSIAAKGGLVLACGDDDQSIYGFRFADPSGIRNFAAEFDAAADLILTECRRCDAEILTAALWVAEQDLLRVPKELHAATGHKGGEVHLLGFKNGRTEVRGIGALCQKLIDEDVSPGEILILMRSDNKGALSQPLVTELTAREIPVTVSAEKQSVLDQEHGRRLLATLRLIANPRDHLAWRTRLWLTDGIGNSTLAVIYAFAAGQGIGFSDAVGRLEEFSSMIPATSLGRLRQQIDYTRSLISSFAESEPDSDTGSEPVSTSDLLEVIKTIAETEIVEEEGRQKVVAFIAEVIIGAGATRLDDLFAALAVNREEMEAELDKNSVNVLTMHQAKGLTADAVFLMAAEDEIMPRDTTDKAISDDRRLLYVSMTRARHNLFITYCGYRGGRQVHLGRNSGEPRRHLTRLLTHSPLRAKAGEDFVHARTSG